MIKKRIESLRKSRHNGKDEDRLAELEQWVEQKRIEDTVNARLRVICMSLTSSTMFGLMWLGQWAYEKSAALEAAIRAFWLANKGGQ